MKTKVQGCESPLIPFYGLSLSNIVDVCSHTIDYEHLVGDNFIYFLLFVHNGSLSQSIVMCE